jgi:hypothetical protein
MVTGSGWSDHFWRDSVPRRNEPLAALRVRKISLLYFLTGETSL